MTRILIVDDERACRESLRMLLSLEEFEVETLDEYLDRASGVRLERLPEE